MADDYIGYKWSSGDATPSTPLEQGPPAFMLHGVGSSTSICTTDDEDNETQFPWTDSQEQFVVQVLQEYQDNPRNTPFSGRFPPSGVVQQVARRVLRRAPRNSFPHSLIAIRKRILLVCAREAPEELPPIASTVQYPEAQQQSFDEPVNQRSLGGGLGAPLQLPINTSSEYEQFDFGLPSQPVVLASPFKEDQRFHRPQQNSGPSSAATSQLDSNVLNIVAQRKRDSLKIKRGLK